MVWSYERDEGGLSELRLGSAGADGREVTKIAGEGWRRSVARYLTPAVSQARLFAGFQRSVAEGDGSRSLVSRLYRYSFASGNLARADVPAQLFVALRDVRSNLTIVGRRTGSSTRRPCPTAASSAREAAPRSRSAAAEPKGDEARGRAPRAPTAGYRTRSESSGRQSRPPRR